jgi:5-methylcytosine-specific restriction protein A
MKCKICHEPGCNVLISASETYCSKHKREPRQPFANAIRYNDSLYKTSQWRTLRKKILKEQPYCFYCGIAHNESRLEVHHRIPPRGNEQLFFNEDNLISICPACHRVITNQEIAKRKK